MKWNEDKSVKLSKFCVYFYMAVLAAVCVLAPWLFRWLITVRNESVTKLPLFLAAAYTSAVPAACALWELHRMLCNISQGKVFIAQNVSILRRLSWYCIAAGLICLVSTAFYPPFLYISAAAAFIGLILRVVKNVFAEAVRLKAENDYTI